MRQIFDNILGLRAKISNLIHYRATNSHNKTEYNFYGPVNFIAKQAKRMKKGTISLHSLPISKKNNS